MNQQKDNLSSHLTFFLEKFFSISKFFKINEKVNQKHSQLRKKLE